MTAGRQPTLPREICFAKVRFVLASTPRERFVLLRLGIVFVDVVLFAQLHSQHILPQIRQRPLAPFLRLVYVPPVPLQKIPGPVHQCPIIAVVRPCCPESFQLLFNDFWWCVVRAIHNVGSKPLVVFDQPLSSAFDFVPHFS